MHRTMTELEMFTQKILFCRGMTAEQVAHHEAGHAFFWHVFFPEVETRYAKKDDCFMVEKASGENVIDTDELSAEDVSKYVYIKLGGIAAEMVYLGIEHAAAEIADFIFKDMQKKVPLFDWDEDRIHGGDISNAIALISAKCHPESVRGNFGAIFMSCIKNIKNNAEYYWTEVKKAKKAIAELSKKSK